VVDKDEKGVGGSKHIEGDNVVFENIVIGGPNTGVDRGSDVAGLTNPISEAIGLGLVDPGQVDTEATGLGLRESDHVDSDPPFWGS
jgi:hypothetical protein